MASTMNWVAGCVLGLMVLIPSLAGTPPEPTVSPAAEADYTIGVEDVLRVTVWGEPGLDLKLRVRPDGKITVPLVNDIKVEGMFPDQVRLELTERISKFIRNPNVTVIVEEINSFRVYVLGEVNLQGALSFYRPPRLLQVLASAGGLTQYSKKEITLIRGVGDKEQRQRIDYKRLLNGNPPQEDIVLRPGDVLLVE